MIPIISINFEDEEEFDYLIKTLYECKNHNLKFQVHGDSSLPVEKQIEILKRIESYYDVLEYPIHIVLHSVYDEDIDESIEKTINYTTKVTDSIDNDKLIISLENLNKYSIYRRLEKE